MHILTISIDQNYKSQLPFKIYSLYETDSINKGRLKTYFQSFQTAFILDQTIKRNVCLRLYRQRYQHNVYRWFHGLQLRLHRGCSASSVRIFHHHWL